MKTFITFQQQKDKYQGLLKFIFPLRPVKAFKSVGTLTLLAALIALGLILNLFAIPIPAIGVSLSFAWLPTMVLGWFFGPALGLVLGFVIDTLNFAIHGGVWFWLYAIQEPLLGMIAGIIGSLCRIAQKPNHKLWISVVINQVVILGFMGFCIAILFIYTDPNNPVFIKLVNSGQITYEVNTIFRWVILGVMLLFLVVVEVLVFNHFQKWKKYQENSKYLTFLYASLVCFASTILFSFVLGPISAIKYYEYLNNRVPPNLLKYGAIYYLLPRVIKECIKTPIYIVLYLAVLMAVTPAVQNILSTARNTYKNDEILGLKKAKWWIINKTTKSLDDQKSQPITTTMAPLDHCFDLTLIQEVKQGSEQRSCYSDPDII